jgi:hypothetical protein
MYSGFIININKTHQYEELGEIYCGIPQHQKGNNFRQSSPEGNFLNCRKCGAIIYAQT